MSDDAPPEARQDDRSKDAADRASVFTWPVRCYLAARFSVAAAFQIQGVAVGWYIYTLTDSALDLGLVGLAMFLPQAALALVAGHIIDRFSRRHVLLAAWSVQAAAGTTIALLALFDLGRIDVIYVLISVFGAGRAFEQPAQAAILPTLVPVSLFARVTPVNSLVNQIAVILGPALGGLLLVPGTSVAFFGTVVMLLIGMGAMYALPPSPPRPAAPLSLQSFLGGIDFIRRAEAVRGAILLDMFGVLLGGGATTLLPIFARDMFEIGPWGFGFMRSAPAIGALVAGLYLARHPLEHRIGKRMFAAVAVFGTATIVFGLSPWLPLSFLALIAMGAADIVSVVVRSTLVQTATPDAIRGRVSAVNSLFVGTSNQLGAFEAGLTAEWFGAVGAVLLGGSLTLLVVAIASRRFPALRRMDRFIMAPAEAD